MSAAVRRRRRTIEERIGAQLRHGKPGDLQGRGEPLKRDRGAIVSRAGGPSGGDSSTSVEHMTAYGTAGQTIADGGGKTLFNRQADPPAERRGFRTFSARLAADGEVGGIPIDVTGFAYVYYRRLFDTFKQSGNLTVRITRGGSNIDHVFPMRAPATRAFDEPLGRFEVQADDTLAIIEPNTSGSGQALSDIEDETVIDVAIWAIAPVASSVPVPPPSADAVWNGDGGTDQVYALSTDDFSVLYMTDATVVNPTAGGNDIVCWTVRTPSPHFEIAERGVTDLSVIRTGTTPSDDPVDIGGTSDTIWHCDRGTDFVYELSTDDFSVERLAVSPSVIPWGMGGDDNTIWHTDRNAGSMYELSTSDFSVVRSQTAISDPMGIGGSADRVWYGDFGSALLYQLDPADFSIINSGNLAGTAPWGIGGA